jgi:hypothetical protein
MSMSALRRLLSIAAIASGARETAPNEAANLAAKEQLSTLNPPEVQPSGTEPLEASENERTKPQ